MVKKILAFTLADKRMLNKITNKKQKGKKICEMLVSKIKRITKKYKKEKDFVEQPSWLNTKKAHKKTFHKDTPSETEIKNKVYIGEIQKRILNQIFYTQEGTSVWNAEDFQKLMNCPQLEQTLKAPTCAGLIPVKSGRRVVFYNIAPLFKTQQEFDYEEKTFGVLCPELLNKVCAPGRFLDFSPQHATYTVTTSGCAVTKFMPRQPRPPFSPVRLLCTACHSYKLDVSIYVYARGIARARCDACQFVQLDFQLTKPSNISINFMVEMKKCLCKYRQDNQEFAIASNLNEEAYVKYMNWFFLVPLSPGDPRYRPDHTRCWQVDPAKWLDIRMSSRLEEDARIGATLTLMVKMGDFRVVLSEDYARALNMSPELHRAPVMRKEILGPIEGATIEVALNSDVNPLVPYESGVTLCLAPWKFFRYGSYSSVPLKGLDSAGFRKRAKKIADKEAQWMGDNEESAVEFCENVWPKVPPVEMKVDLEVIEIMDDSEPIEGLPPASHVLSQEMEGEVEKQSVDEDTVEAIAALLMKFQKSNSQLPF